MHFNLPKGGLDILKSPGLDTVFARKYYASDVVSRLENAPIFLDDVNIHIYENDIYYGSGTLVEAVATAGSVISFRHINLQDFFVKNYTAGSNGKIVVVGTYEKRGGV